MGRAQSCQASPMREEMTGRARVALINYAIAHSRAVIRRAVRPAGGAGGSGGDSHIDGHRIGLWIA